MTDQNYWGGTDPVYQCLIDEERTLAFRNVINKVVKEGDVVVDLGSGTGIQAMFAADAGARIVYAIEADGDIFKTLQESLISNQYKNIIPIQGDATTCVLPEKVDVVICEMVATGLIDETQIYSINNIIPQCNEGARILPMQIENFIELVEVDDAFYGHKLSIVQYEYPWLKARGTKSMTMPYMYKAVDFRTINNNYVDISNELVAIDDGIVSGIRITNQSHFPDDSVLGATAAYCMPMILPVEKVKLSRGDKIILSLQYNMCGGLKDFSCTIDKK